jgi:DNA invertase Pin-like site-specific DNA recombinase
MATTKTATPPKAEPPPGTQYGYARVSSRKQKEDRQIIALLQQGILRRNIFVDKQSGKDFDREEYQRLLKKIKPGDCISVEELDRFGRDYDEILENWQHITKKMGVDIVVLECPMLDTRVKNHDLTGRLICDLLLGLLSYLAEMERRMNHQRQAEGIAVARARGVRFGRPEKTPPDIFGQVLSSWTNGTLSERAAARALCVAPQTFRGWALSHSAAGTDK